jgi:glutamate-1-semialdehyde aminotransferase
LSFLEIGFDSLFLTQAASALQEQFNTKITLRTLMEDAPTLALLVERILPTLISATVDEAEPPDAREHRPNEVISESRLRHVAALVERYQRRTAKSWAAAEAHRAYLVDPDSAFGDGSSFRAICYPLVSARSLGAHLTDVDGNDYVDVTNGFGAVLFGHNPAFVRQAIDQQYEVGIGIGENAMLAREVSSLVCEMVAMERAAVCSTGSEAAEAAIRLARRASGRDAVVMFAEDSRATGDVTVLEYGTPESLEAIRAMSGRLAAVLVEPVPSRHRESQPREFLHELRNVTSHGDTALIFDEFVTGFRVHPGGAQTLFGVRADLATYGDIIAGGLPIGVVAGSARYLDGHRGKDSGHPLALAAACAMLRRLKEEGPALQRRLNLRTTAMVDRLKDVVTAVGAPVQIDHFSSWFVVSFPQEPTLAPLYHALMREKGVYTWDCRPGFLTAAHGDAELDRVVEAFRATLAEMQAADFLPRRSETPRKGRDASGREAWFVPDPHRPGKYLKVADADA